MWLFYNKVKVIMIRAICSCRLAIQISKIENYFTLADNWYLKKKPCGFGNKIKTINTIYHQNRYYIRSQKQKQIPLIHMHYRPLDWLGITT